MSALLTHVHVHMPVARQGLVQCMRPFMGRSEKSSAKTKATTGKDGAEERTRTSTGLPPLPPQGSVSTNSTTTACFPKLLRLHQWPSQSSDVDPIERLSNWPPTTPRGNAIKPSTHGAGGFGASPAVASVLLAAEGSTGTSALAAGTAGASVRGSPVRGEVVRGKVGTSPVTAGTSPATTGAPTAIELASSERCFAR